MNPTANNWQYYAVTPLAKAPVKTHTIIRNYDIDTGLAEEQQLAIKAVLPALLVSQCLHQLDQYRAFAAGLNREVLSNDGDEAVGRITIAINDITTTIVDSVAPLFKYVPNSVYSNAAQQTLRSQLEQRLGDAYDAAVIMVSTVTGNALLYHHGIAYPELDDVNPYSIPHPAITAPVFVISQQAAAALPEDSLDIAQLNRWTYTASFSRNAIAYGSKAFIHFWLGDPPDNNTAAIEVNCALLDSLLQFDAVAPLLIQVLETAGTTAAQQETALLTFAHLAASVATSWKAEPVIAMEAPATDTAAAWQLEEYTDTNENGEQTGIVLRRPVNEDWTRDWWPDIFLDDSDTALTANLLSDDTCFYAAALENVNTIRIALPQLHAFTQSKVSAGIAVQQNYFSDSIIATDPAFAAFITPFSWTLEAARPHLQYTASIVLPGSDTTTALQHFFTTLLGTDSTILLHATMSYEYKLDASGLPVTIPVTLLPYTPWQEGIAALPGVMQQWKTAAQPPAGCFVMAVLLADGDGELMTLGRLEIFRLV